MLENIKFNKYLKTKSVCYIMERRLSEFLFNMKTLDLMSNDSRDVLHHTFSEFNFSSELVDLVLDSKHILKFVLLRLRVDSNHDKNHVSKELRSLNHDGVNSLVQYLFNDTDMNDEETTHVDKEEHVDDNNDNDDDDEDGTKSEEELSVENKLDSFLNDKVLKTDNTEDVVKLSEFYLELNAWWDQLYKSDDIPEKKVLKSYLNDKLGKSSGSKWTNVSIN